MPSPAKAAALMALALILAAMGIYSAIANDAPGGAVGGFLLMLVAVVIGVRATRNRLPVWARRGALVVGVLIAAPAAFVTHAAAIAAPLFGQPADVPAATEPAPSPQMTAAVDRARPMVRAAIVEQNLPGVSIAVGMDGSLVWAEGFGWRDVATRAPVTPKTRFHIGTAASAVTAKAIAPLGLTSTGVEPAANWSPGHIGEPEEDAPPLKFVHDVILRPMGLADPAKPLPDDRATFYVPTTFWRGVSTDPRDGRRLMSMRDLACCAGGMALYSTPPDLIRFVLATQADSLDGQLAGGTVMSVLTRRDKRVIVAVASNIAYANTAALAAKVADAFAQAK